MLLKPNLPPILSPAVDNPAELGVCIALWRQPEVVMQALLQAGLEASQFQTPAYRAFVEAAFTVYSSGEGLTALTITGRLLEGGTLDADTFFALQDKLSGDTPIYLPDHLQAVRQQTYAREARGIVEQFLSELKDKPASAGAAVPALASRLLSIVAGRQTEDPRVMAQLQRWAALPSVGISTGLPDLDKALDGGLVPGRTVIFGAPTGEGKTALGCFFAANAVRQECPVVYFSTEMGAGPILHRILANLATIWELALVVKDTDVASFFRERPTDVADYDEVQTAIAAAVERADPCLRVYDRVFSVPEMVARIRLHRNEFGHLPLVIVDHLHRTQPPPSRTGRAYQKTQEMYADIVYSLDSAILEANTCLVMFSQLSIATEREFRASNKVTSLAFKEAGEIQNVASSAFIFGKHKDKALTTVMLLKKDRIRGREMRLEFAYDPETYSFAPVKS